MSNPKRIGDVSWRRTWADPSRHPTLGKPKKSRPIKDRSTPVDLRTPRPTAPVEFAEEATDIINIYNNCYFLWN